MLRGRLVRIVAFLPLAESLQHLSRGDTVAPAVLVAEHLVGFDDLHHSYAHGIADRLVLVNPWNLSFQEDG